MRKRILFGLTGFFILASGLSIWLGAYNIGATSEHWPITTELLEIVRERSILARSKDIVKPDTLLPGYLTKGARNYAAMCAQCHLSPGTKPTELHRGLYPQPPVFHEGGHETHNPGANFWVIKNGIKLTGMPAWGKVHSDEEIWGLVAFIDRLPNMTADEYQQATASDGDPSSAHHSGTEKQH